MKEVFIVGAKRTPVGGLLGNLSHLSATQLGAHAIKSALASVHLAPGSVDEVLMGNVLSAGIGQSPARQAAIFADIPHHVDATTINKVCASGLKSVMLGAQQIQLGAGNIIIAGGMESMSNTPHYAYLRRGHKFGNTSLADGMLKDGLWDVYNDYHMGSAAELCARTYNITREAQDEYALMSYARAVAATKAGKFADEVAPVEIVQKGATTTVADDEDIYKVIPDKVGKLKPAFEDGGTVTAANASNLNDGAATVILASADAVATYNLTPVARIIGFADAAETPEWFTTAPAKAIPKAITNAGLSASDIDYYEINEAYAAVAIANMQILGIDAGKVNVYGGAVAIGHPLGASGTRILCTLLSVLKQERGRYGVAAICNGGGGSSAMVIESLS
jgi:acetyl-CoA C-acetyltransferase